MATVSEAKSLICEMCRNFYEQGWVSGTGGGMSIKVGDRIVMAPSGVQKERMQEEDMFLLDQQGNILKAGQHRAPPYKPPKLSECSPLFMAAYELRDAGAVLHSHSINAVMATLLQPGNRGECGLSEFRVTNLEMIKGISGHGYYDECIVPIIENTARECELTASLREAIRLYPKANAVLVKRHGVYVWGSNWIQAKTQAECYEYLFEAAVRLKAMGIDVSQAPPVLAVNGSLNGHIEAEGREVTKKPKLQHMRTPEAIVLDIEGTITPISFVKDTLFPYARQHLKEHLEKSFETPETQADILLLRKEAADANDQAAVSHPIELACVSLSDKEATIAAVADFAGTLMAEDRKSTALKALQGHIWREGFQTGRLKSDFYEDFLAELPKWRQEGIKIFIYSSGSREAQKNMFANSPSGDLRQHLCGFFDTTVGAKVEARSYTDIAQTIGVDRPEAILFATDSFKEAEAAEAAGWQIALTTRSGNAALPQSASSRFRLVHSMAQLLLQ